jgi:hypothetical protein
MRSDLALPQISAGDLDIAVVSQLAATKLPLGDEFEPGSVKDSGLRGSVQAWGPLEGGFGTRAAARERRSYSPTPMPNSTTERSGFHRASGGKRKNIAVRLRRWTTPLGYRFRVKPKYARAPATRTPSQLTQNGMLKPPISTCHPKMIRRRCIIATTRNSVAVTVI